ncbi:MAG TPA: EAL domain-containing protein [Pyrinomonadaceae bacterium]|nr:EAL domain-containing protein [Pyrinomonadaceae bacterium]
MNNNSEKLRARILIVDDQTVIRNMLFEMLTTKYDCQTASSGEEAIGFLEKEKFNLVLSDIEMGGMSGIELIPHILELSPDTVVVMISSNQDIESAINAQRLGAFDYIRKPFEFSQFELTIERALNHNVLLNNQRKYENHLEEMVKQRTDELNFLSNYDVLTNLPNRNLFEDRLAQALSLANYNKQDLAVLLLSVNRLKDIDDAFGQTQVDHLLQEIAERIKNHSFDGVTIAKFDSSEFAIMLTQITSTEDVIEFTNDIKTAIEKPFVIENEEIFITFSIGICLFPTDGKDSQVILKNARAALSRSKEHGLNNYQFYTTDMNTFALVRLAMENNLRGAVERDEFEVYYQPKVCVKTQEIVGMEALIRWQHPTLGIFSPDEFIPLAEETGLIVPLGELVLRNACRQIKIWHEEGFPYLTVSVNLSAFQFQQTDLLARIAKIIDETGMDPASLEFELTESAVMKNVGYAGNIMNQLKKMGIKISIDDFGTGYSSLGYLKRLPVDILKIDKSFIKDMTIDPDDASLVMTIISLAHNLGLKVIAEGVETDEQLRFLKLLRCDQWQGYLCSKPVPADELKELLCAKDLNNATVARNRFLKLIEKIESNEPKPINSEYLNITN